jgi:hypothetical protein
MLANVDLDLRFAVILLVYSKRIHEHTPYPITTVNANSMISEPLSKYKIWRVANRSKIIRTIITPPATIGICLLSIEKVVEDNFLVTFDNIDIITVTNIL